MKTENTEITEAAPEQANTLPAAPEARAALALPAGKTCGDCVNVRHCTAFYAHTPADTYCDFFPRRFRERVATGQEGGAAHG